MNTALWLMSALAIKHLIVDFFLQTRYQYSNKGTYGHGGGILHAGLHALATWIVFAAVVPYAWILAMADAVIHYHVDWAKVNINDHFGWTATTHEQFWWLLGVDQFLHFATYVALVAFVVN
jgi:hypothetical protein